ncbi:MAG: hypothetical protein GXY88_00740 [Tissierellia bacterium]|nr:hypothetical protein [Tissierellia bacterium]
MLCQICNKNKATVHYTKIVNGEVEKIHLCDECYMTHYHFDFDTAFPFHKLLSGLLDSMHEGYPKDKIGDIVCPFCNLSYSEFKQTGKFGCSQCYEVFKSNLVSLLRSIHGHNKHIGKVPKRGNKRIAKEREIERLRMELEKLVAREAFEEAAILRDEIKRLEEELGR